LTPPTESRSEGGSEVKDAYDALVKMRKELKEGEKALRKNGEREITDRLERHAHELSVTIADLEELVSHEPY
jgi:translation elongation factor EF-Ts